jgi:hypothetical protein
MCSNVVGAAAPLSSTDSFHSDSNVGTGISRYITAYTIQKMTLPIPQRRSAVPELIIPVRPSSPKNSVARKPPIA